MMLNLKNQAAASNGKAAVMIGELGGVPVLVRYAPKSIGNPKNRAEMDYLITKALDKLGWKRDRRARCGYRRVSA